MLDPKDQVAAKSYVFIEEGVSKAESVLVHSVKGQSRACTILAAYIMFKYGLPPILQVSLVVAEEP